MYKIVERNIGRAGTKQQAKKKQEYWDLKYGKGKWITGYELEGKFLTREEAIKKVYNQSYFDFLDKNPNYVEELKNSGGVFNPHALLSNSYDIQANTVEEYMRLRGLSFEGTIKLPIGSYQPRRNKERVFKMMEELGLTIRDGKIQYPSIAYALSPFNVPCTYNPKISIESFWQSGAKCLAVKSNTFSTQVGDVFKLAKDNDVICITTNGMVNRNGDAIMGIGIAKIAKDKLSGIEKKLGQYIKQYGNRSFNLGSYNYKGKKITMATFPTKHNWRDKSDLNLIKKSAQEIMEMANKFNWNRVYLPMPGGGAGGLKWKDIKPALSNLDERFVVISLNSKDFVEHRQ